MSPKIYPLVKIEYLDHVGYNEVVSVDYKFSPSVVHISGYYLGTRKIKGMMCCIIAQEYFPEEQELRDVTVVVKKCVTKLEIIRDNPSTSDKIG